METFVEISQNITIDLIYHCWVSVMVLFEAKTTRFNIILQHNVHDWPFTIDREFN
jgi:hypothetical protein